LSLGFAARGPIEKRRDDRFRRTAAARGQAETFLERPVFGIKRPFANAGVFAVRAAAINRYSVVGETPRRCAI
jgi:hypothetical protein